MNLVTLIRINYSNLFNFTNLKISDHYQRCHVMFSNPFTRNKHETRKRKINGKYTHPAFTCSKSTIETPEQCVKSVQSNNKDTKTTSMTSFWCFYC